MWKKYKGIGMHNPVSMLFIESQYNLEKYEKYSG